MSATPQDDTWDDEFARQLVGKLCLIGVTKLNADGSLNEEYQLQGKVEVVDESEGISFALTGKRAGDYWDMPPMFSAFHPAEPGDYTLKSSGETVSNPAYLVVVTIRKPAQ